MSPFVAYIRGLPETPSIREINIRSGPHKAYELVIKVPVGTSNLTILDVKVDEKGENFQGKAYQWFQLSLPDGKQGWARDDLLEISGDGTPFGYSAVNTQTFAFTLRRGDAAGARSPAPVAPPTPPTPAAPAAPAPAAPAPAAPPAPTAPAAAPTPISGAPAPAPAAPPTVVTGPATLIIKTQGAANTRNGPGTNFERTGLTLPRHGRFAILEARQEQAGQQYRWFKTNNQGRDLWIREDLVTYGGDTSAIGLPTDLYPCPMKENYWWVRGYNMPPNKDAGLVDHDGWDLGAATGEPMYAGPNGGLIVKSFECVNCKPDRPSTLMAGFSLGDPRIFTDPGWGNGYGHYIIVRYTNDQLPVSTRNLLASRGFGGGAIFVMYAHLHQRLAQEGQTLTPGQQIATCGNTGNSEAAHLHLEIRASKDPNLTHWANIRSGVMDAVALFKR